MVSGRIPPPMGATALIEGLKLLLYWSPNDQDPALLPTYINTYLIVEFYKNVNILKVNLFL